MNTARTLVTSYADPDLDGFAGAVAYAEFLNREGQVADVRFFGTVHDEAAYVCARFGIAAPLMIEDAKGYEHIILVDASDMNGLSGRLDPVKVSEIIDHRSVNELEKFPNAMLQIELVGAAATLIAERFREAGVEMSKESATLVSGAILSNTLNFKASVTTERDHAAFRYTSKTAALPDDFVHELFKAKSDLTGAKLEERIRSDFAYKTFGGKSVGIAQLEILGVETLIAERKDEIIAILEKLKKEENLEMVFQNTIDLEEVTSVLVTDDAATAKLLEATLDVVFKNHIAVRSPVLMRKQIAPLLKQELEK